MRLFQILCLMTICLNSNYCDVKSNSGQIHFDVDSDATSEMSLTSQGLGIGNDSPQSSLHITGNLLIDDAASSVGTPSLKVNGSFGFGLELVSDNLTLSNNTMVLVDSSSQDIDLSLPFAGNSQGLIYHIKKTSKSNNVTIFGNGTTIDLDYSVNLVSNTIDSMSLVSDGSQWHVYNYNGEFSPLSDNLIGWYKLNETTGSIASDSSGYDRHGTIGGGIDFSSHSVSGKIGSAIDFENQDYLDVSTHDFNLLDNYSVSFWVNTDIALEVGNARRLGFFSNGSNGSFDNYMAIQDSMTTTAVYSEDSAGTQHNAGALTITVGTWHHFAFSMSGGTVSVYLDGDFATSFSGGTGYDLNYFGTGYGGATNNGSMDGQMDDLKFFNKALNSEEIQTIALEGRN